MTSQRVIQALCLAVVGLQQTGYGGPTALDSSNDNEPELGITRQGISVSLTRPDYSATHLLFPSSFTSKAAEIQAVEGTGKVTVTPLESLSLNRTHSSGAVYPTTGGLTFSSWFRWNTQDNDDGIVGSEWNPQGMSGTWDSGAQIGAADWMAVTWPHRDYNLNVDDALRISFSKSPSATGTYRHVLLVNTVADSTVPGGYNLTAIKRHGDGLVWYKKYLYVADACNGFMVFDTHHVWHISDYNDESVGWDTARSSFHARYHLYAMPLIGWYRWSTGWNCTNGATGTGENHPALASAHLDRTSVPGVHTLYGTSLDGRAVGWTLNQTTGLPVLSSDNLAHPSVGYKFGGFDGLTHRLTAFAVVGGNVYAADIDGATRDPYGTGGCLHYTDLYKGAKTGSSLAFTGFLNSCTEALSYRSATGRLWTINETQGHKEINSFVP
ncbi:hypothetical protein [Vitiosangium sp. GDMCC 1.1324]|uniref:hypothetical protein n=1 Tax=Vitiosangium sp. (strain GDMCC 1.1324) TaxID=2138576 RepID=UPI0011B6401B|nr:hypothetical protein [Vitiosangium sp. GDMCC 1.1324]